MNSGKISAGCVDNEIVHIADLLPTFSSIAGYDVPLVNFDPSIKLDSAGLDEEFGMGDMVPRYFTNRIQIQKRHFYGVGRGTYLFLLIFIRKSV